tara:strand:+ start:23926 stop:24378 length:453 start_codon:yes stop_codon:yes gene_type:complete
MASFMGIDPGQTGGVAIIGDDSLAQVMPLTGKQVDGAKIAFWLKTFDPKLVVVEQVHSMPKQGVASSFKFGVSYGIVIGAVLAAGIPLQTVTPQAWKKKILAGTTRDKHAAIEFSARMFPWADLTPGAKRKPHDGIADALCLAEFARQLG